MKYPLQDPPLYGDSDYKSRNGVIRDFIPNYYLSLLPKLSLDDESLENIEILYNMIINGEKIDPPTLYLEGNKIVDHDGRHRAYAAIKAGLNNIPVLLLDVNNEIPQIENYVKQERLFEIINDEINKMV
jgi:hypothetical protein